MSATFPVLLDGYTDLPPGKIANVVTFLEMTEPPATVTAPAGFAVAVARRPDPAAFLALYRRIGETWLWTSRAAMPPAELAALLALPTTEMLTLEKDGAAIGLVELDYSVPGDVEIVTFGVVPEAMGTGAAQIMMGGTLARIFGGGAARVWLHTCTFDHPRALGFYRRNGFRPYKFAIEVSDDPRRTGHLPVTAGPHVPLIGNRP
ncbi:MAG: GNAT family N-acetyltransferase [Bauldia sp.]